MSANGWGIPVDDSSSNTATNGWAVDLSESTGPNNGNSTDVEMTTNPIELPIGDVRTNPTTEWSMASIMEGATSSSRGWKGGNKTNSNTGYVNGTTDGGWKSRPTTTTTTENREFPPPLGRSSRRPDSHSHFGATAISQPMDTFKARPDIPKKRPHHIETLLHQMSLFKDLPAFTCDIMNHMERASSIHSEIAKAEHLLSQASKEYPVTKAGYERDIGNEIDERRKESLLEQLTRYKAHMVVQEGILNKTIAQNKQLLASCIQATLKTTSQFVITETQRAVLGSLQLIMATSSNDLGEALEGLMRISAPQIMKEAVNKSQHQFNQEARETIQELKKVVQEKEEAIKAMELKLSVFETRINDLKEVAECLALSSPQPVPENYSVDPNNDLRWQERFEEHKKEIWQFVKTQLNNEAQITDEQ